MQNLITSSPLIWGCLLAAMVALPILIHLINRLRHQPIQWAAMDFLLASHKKNRNQVWLRQLLLLLSRIAALLLILFTVAQTSCHDSGLARLTGTQTTHHYILIDDSMSMNESIDGQSPIQRAGEVVTQLAKRVAGRENHRMTVIRYSQARQAGNDEGPRMDVSGQAVDRAVEKSIQQLASGLTATSLALEPNPSLQIAQQLIQQQPNQSSLVYVLSDFRSADWNNESNATAITEALTGLEELGATVNLIRCTDEPGENLAITSLRPVSNITVAGIPAMMEVQVQNLGKTDARRIQVRLESAIYPQDERVNSPDSIEPETIELSSVLIDEIPAGQIASRQFPVFFNQTGQHAIRATLPDDALQDDNQRWVVTSFASTKKVLMVDESADRSGRVLALALSAGNLTGLTVEQANQSTLRDITLEKLMEYETVFLLDVKRFDETAVGRLEEFAKRGGGVVFFLGPNVSAQHYREALYRDGDGILPMPLSNIESVPESLQSGTADLVVTKHPIFDSVSSVENSPLDSVQLQKHWSVAESWTSALDESVDSIAFVRGDQSRPLVIEKRIGQGTVIAITTTSGPEWNNWIANPTYPPTVLLLQNYVSRGRAKLIERTVGWSKEFQLPIIEFEPNVTFVAANSEDGFGRTTWNVTATSPEEGQGTNSSEMTARIGGDVDETKTPGVYESWLTRRDQAKQIQRFALNFDKRESDLAIAERRTIQSAVAGTDTSVIDWNAFAMTSTRPRGSSLLRWLLLGLVVILVCEQILAWKNSYHPG